MFIHLPIRDDVSFHHRSEMVSAYYLLSTIVETVGLLYLVDLVHHLISLLHFLHLDHLLIHSSLPGERRSRPLYCFIVPSPDLP
jgi:hypothetical protein